MLYQAYQLQSDLSSPLRLMAQAWSAGLWMNGTEGSVLRKVASALDVFSRLRLTHTRPAYGITTALLGGETPVPVREEATLKTPFGTLLHFVRELPPGTPPQPRVLLVAPLSGHFATLLRS